MTPADITLHTMIFRLGWTPRGVPARPHVCFAEPPASARREAASEVALAGRDGQRAADLLAASKRAGTDVLASLTERAVRRLLAMGGRAAAVPVLFDDEELEQLRASFAATIATADLLGRSRVRQFVTRHQEAEKHAFAEPPDFIAALTDALSATPSQHGNARLIGRVFDAVKSKLPDLTRAEFDRQLIEAHRSGQITLSRIDLPQGIDPADIRQSQVNLLNAEFHLIEPGRRAGGRTGVPAPSPPIQPPPTAGPPPPALPGRDDSDPFTPFPEPIPFQPPAEAVKYFQSLVPTLGTDPYRYGALLERHAFTLAVATDQTILDKVKRVINERLIGLPGSPIGTATADIQDILEAAGVAPANPQYAEQVYRTSMMDSLNHGQMAELQSPEMQEFFPVYRYEGIKDGRQGKDHEPHFGKYYPVSRPFADVRGPRVWNCRCSITPIFKGEWATLQAAGERLSSL